MAARRGPQWVQPGPPSQITSFPSRSPLPPGVPLTPSESKLCLFWKKVGAGIRGCGHLDGSEKPSVGLIGWLHLLPLQWLNACTPTFCGESVVTDSHHSSLSAQCLEFWVQTSQLSYVGEPCDWRWGVRSSPQVEAALSCPPRVLRGPS